MRPWGTASDLANSVRRLEEMGSTTVVSNLNLLHLIVISLEVKCGQHNVQLPRHIYTKLGFFEKSERKLEFAVLFLHPLIGFNGATAESGEWRGTNNLELPRSTSTYTLSVSMDSTRNNFEVAQ